MLFRSFDLIHQSNIMIPCNLCKHLLHNFSIRKTGSKLRHISQIPYRILYFIRKEECDLSPHSSKNFFLKEFSAGCQPRYPIKISIMTWKSLSPPRGLQLHPSCQARCPVKPSNEMEFYSAPSTAQLLTMLLHREHFYSYFYYTQSAKKINYDQHFFIMPESAPVKFICFFILFYANGFSTS